MSDAELESAGCACEHGPNFYGGVIDTDSATWRIFCLGHNFDVVGTILMMADVSWRKGWDSGLAVRSLTDAKPLLTY